MKTNNLEFYKIVKDLREMGLLDAQGQLLPAAKEGAEALVRLLYIALALPCVAAAATVICLAGGTGSIMLLWWLLFI